MHKPIVESLSFYLSLTISFKAAAYFGIPKITGSDVLYITLMLSLNLFWKENKKTWIAYFKLKDGKLYWFTNRHFCLPPAFRRNGEGNVFTGVCPFTPRGGGTPIWPTGGGIPHPRSGWGGGCRTVKVTDTEPYYIRAVPATKAGIQTKTPLYT